MAMSDQVARRGDRQGGLLPWKDAKLRREAAQIAPYLDTEFYLENNADVAAAGIEPPFHYAKYGWREGRDPSPSFSTAEYLAAHPKLALSGTNPLLHFIQSGHGEAGMDDGDMPSEAEIALVDQHVDAVFYAKEKPRFEASGLTAAEHYCRFGWRDGADPSPDFSTRYYLLTNPDIRDKGVNPFWHFLIAGQAEGRLPMHPGGWRYAIQARQTNFEAHCAPWLRKDTPPPLLAGDALVTAIEAARQTAGLAVSLGHDDYRKTPGGVQLCIEIEARDAVSRGLDYLNLHPWQPLPKLADRDADPILGLVLNGETLGLARASSVVAALPRLQVQSGGGALIIHHLAGHTPEAVVALAKALKIKRAHFWLHDYFTLCTSYALQRNNVSPCNVPAVDSNACGICLFGKARREQLERVRALFEALDVTVVTPSEVAFDFWKGRSDLTCSGSVLHPHVTLTPKARPPSIEAPSDARVRIGFIGTPAPHKGWPVFTELQRRLAANPDYEFLFFGTKTPTADGIAHVPTLVRGDDPSSTMRAIEAHAVDIVLHWASWRETFSFSCFEALGGGAYVVTNAGSGNVASTVSDLQMGVVLETTEELFELAKCGGLRDLALKARAARRSGGLDARFSGMTLDLLDEKVNA